MEQLICLILLILGVLAACFDMGGMLALQSAFIFFY